MKSFLEKNGVDTSYFELGQAEGTTDSSGTATQGTQRCKGRFLFLANDGSRNPLVAAGAPNRVDCITGHLSRGPECAASPEICGNVEELFISVMAAGNSRIPQQIKSE